MKQVGAKPGELTASEAIELGMGGGVTQLEVTSTTIRQSMDTVIFFMIGRWTRFLGGRFGSGDGGRKTLLTRHIAFGTLPASGLLVVVRA